MSSDSVWSPTNTASFSYHSDFPEPGLSKALLETQGIIQADKLSIGQMLKAAGVIYEVTVVGQILYHFGVPEYAMEARMKALGMHLQYKEIVTRARLLVDRVPRRDSSDTRCVNFREQRYDSGANNRMEPVLSSTTGSGSRNSLSMACRLCILIQVEHPCASSTGRTKEEEGMEGAKFGGLCQNGVLFLSAYNYPVTPRVFFDATLSAAISARQPSFLANFSQLQIPAIRARTHFWRVTRHPGSLKLFVAR
ncbi:hypothetical protein DFH09DRAFT_1273471 [Mycena vulgaris]|nr:hypothetical protein DFH09DRAFT_1273471 [Mycena vulgaris]